MVVKAYSTPHCCQLKHLFPFINFISSGDKCATAVQLIVLLDDCIENIIPLTAQVMASWHTVVDNEPGVIASRGGISLFSLSP